jgi:hypothetical protein
MSYIGAEIRFHKEDTEGRTLRTQKEEKKIGKTINLPKTSFLKLAEFHYFEKSYIGEDKRKKGGNLLVLCPVILCKVYSLLLLCVLYFVVFV